MQTDKAGRVRPLFVGEETEVRMLLAHRDQIERLVIASDSFEH